METREELRQRVRQEQKITARGAHPLPLDLTMPRLKGTGQLL